MGGTSGHGPREGNILIIDDEKIFREVLADMLRKEGFDVTLAGDGQSGIATAKGNTFDVIILDIVMPGLSGFDTLLALKKFFPDIPVIMVTSHDSTENYRESMQRGAYDYMAKPLNRDKLLRVLDGIFEKRNFQKDESNWLERLERLKKGTAVLRKQISGRNLELFTQNFDSFLSSVVMMIVEVLQVKTASIMLVDYDTHKLVLKASYGLNNSVLKNVSRPLGEGIAGWVAQSGEPLLIKNMKEDRRFSESHFADQYDTASLLCVPVMGDGRVEAVINVNNKRNGTAFDEKDLTLLTMFANNLEFALVHRSLYLLLQEQLRELALLYQIANRIGSAKDFESLVEDLMKTVHDAFQVEASSLLLAKTKAKKLYFRSSVGPKQELLGKFEIAFGEGLAGWAAANNQSVICNDVAGDSRYSDLIDTYTGFTTRSVLCVPLIHHGKVMGVIELINRRDGASFTERDRVLLEAIASQTVLVLRNSLLNHSLQMKVKEALAGQKRETQLKKILSRKMKEIEKLKQDSFITFKIEDFDEE